MNNVNIDFNFKYPGKKERVIYTVTSILKDEIRLFGKSIISAILVCVCFENGWILPQEHCGNDDFMIVMFSIFYFMQCAILINIFSGLCILNNVAVVDEYSDFDCDEWQLEQEENYQKRGKRL